MLAIACVNWQAVPGLPIIDCEPGCGRGDGLTTGRLISEGQRGLLAEGGFMGCGSIGGDWRPYRGIR
jgi:hypothetical protein